MSGPMNTKLVRREEFQKNGLWLNSSSYISSAHKCSSLYHIITWGRFTRYLKCEYMQESLHYLHCLQFLWPLQWEKEAHRTQLQHQSSVRFANKLKSRKVCEKLLYQNQIFEKMHTFISNLDVSEGITGRVGGFLKLCLCLTIPC